MTALINADNHKSGWAALETTISQRQETMQRILKIFSMWTQTRDMILERYKINTNGERLGFIWSNAMVFLRHLRAV